MGGPHRDGRHNPAVGEIGQGQGALRVVRAVGTPTLWKLYYCRERWIAKSRALVKIPNGTWGRCLH